jgi:urate oxidase
MITLGENRYGKSRVRLVRLTRGSKRHDLREWTLEISLQGDFESCFKDGDNSKILPTDTMKNTVYSLARTFPSACMEEFGKEFIDFILRRNPHISQADVAISAKLWEHLVVGGEPHRTTFVQSSGERQTVKVTRTQCGEFSVTSGLENLIIMKTAESGFEGYIQDSLTTLPPTKDRLFGTALHAAWIYTSALHDFDRLRVEIREILLSAFASHASKSVQHTLYAMGHAVLERITELSEIELTMPNIHCLLVDLSRFGQDNPNEIFVPTDEPYGHIEAHVRRQG